MRNHISHTAGKDIVIQVFGFVFLYCKVKTNYSGPNGNKHSTAKKYMKVTLLGLPHSAQYRTMYPNRLYPKK